MGDKILCGFPEDEYLDDGETAVDTVPLATDACTHTRQRRNTQERGSDELAHSFFDYTYDDGSNFVFEEVHWPTDSGITEEEDHRVCRNAVESSPAYKTCINMVQADDLITSCVEDVKVM